MSPRPTRPPRAVYSRARLYARTYAHERETRTRIPSGVCYEGGLLGSNQREGRGNRKSSASDEPWQKHLAKKSSCRDFAQLKAKSKGGIRGYLNRADIHLSHTHTHTHTLSLSLFWFLSGEITSRVLTLSWEVPLEISNENTSRSKRERVLRETRALQSFTVYCELKLQGARRRPEKEAGDIREGLCVAVCCEDATRDFKENFSRTIVAIMISGAIAKIRETIYYK